MQSASLQLDDGWDSAISDPQRTLRYRALGIQDIMLLPELARMSRERLFAMEVVSKVLPFRANGHVIKSLIHWDDAPDDPIYRIVFPAREMLDPGDYEAMADLVRSNAPNAEIRGLANAIRRRLNPHPSGQQEYNVPVVGEESLRGVQHKYRETVLFFPARGQTCHAYCTFCFRWAQFVGDRDLKMACTNLSQLLSYLRGHPEVTDLLLTGGDPMIMATRHLEDVIDPVLGPRLDHVRTIRLGTKALTYWPQRFVSDDDADALLRLIERVVARGRHVAIMAHTNHWRELDNPIATLAIRRLRDAGAVIRSQGPVLARINDEPAVWARMWQEQVRLGIVPYYMFVERDTGPRRYFEVPLGRAWRIHRNAVSQVSGLARTARGPIMSTTEGKVEVIGISGDYHEPLYILQFLQARNPDLVRRPFLASGPKGAVWFNDLEPIPEFSHMHAMIRTGSPKPIDAMG